jgi:hypothetical protein
MGFDDIIRSGLGTLNTLTSSLKVTVTHEAWVSKDVHAKPSYADPISRQAIVEHRQEWMRTRDGNTLVAKPVVIITEPIADNGASGRAEPVDPRDRITLPDNRVLTQLRVEMVMDPATNRPYSYEISGEV